MCIFHRNGINFRNLVFQLNKLTTLRLEVKEKERIFENETTQYLKFLLCLKIKKLILKLRFIEYANKNKNWCN